MNGSPRRGLILPKKLSYLGQGDACMNAAVLAAIAGAAKRRHHEGTKSLDDPSTEGPGRLFRIVSGKA
ncbi:MAG: hypothetical protein AB8H86_18940 [Polyangiales bacterium]